MLNQYSMSTKYYLLHDYSTAEEVFKLYLFEHKMIENVKTPCETSDYCFKNTCIHRITDEYMSDSDTEIEKHENNLSDNSVNQITEPTYADNIFNYSIIDKTPSLYSAMTFGGGIMIIPENKIHKNYAKWLYEVILPTSDPKFIMKTYEDETYVNMLKIGQIYSISDIATIEKFNLKVNSFLIKIISEQNNLTVLQYLYNKRKLTNAFANSIIEVTSDINILNWAIETFSFDFDEDQFVSNALFNAFNNCNLDKLKWLVDHDCKIDNSYAYLTEAGKNNRTDIFDYLLELNYNFHSKIFSMLKKFAFGSDIVESSKPNTLTWILNNSRLFTEPNNFYNNFDDNSDNNSNDNFDNNSDNNSDNMYENILLSLYPTKNRILNVFGCDSDETNINQISLDQIHYLLVNGFKFNDELMSYVLKISINTFNTEILDWINTNYKHIIVNNLSIDKTKYASLSSTKSIIEKCLEKQNIEILDWLKTNNYINNDIIQPNTIKSAVNESTNTESLEWLYVNYPILFAQDYSSQKLEYPFRHFNLNNLLYETTLNNNLKIVEWLHTKNLIKIDEKFNQIISSIFVFNVEHVLDYLIALGYDILNIKLYEKLILFSTCCVNIIKWTQKYNLFTQINYEKLIFDCIKCDNVIAISYMHKHITPLTNIKQLILHAEKKNAENSIKWLNKTFENTLIDANLADESVKFNKSSNSKFFCGWF